MTEGPAPVPDSKLPLPGMAAISLYMLALALVGVAGVLTRHYPPGSARIGILILCSVFAVAGRRIPASCGDGYPTAAYAALMPQPQPVAELRPDTRDPVPRLTPRVPDANRPSGLPATQTRHPQRAPA